MEMREKFVGRLLNNAAEFGFTQVKLVNAPQIQVSRWVRQRCWYSCTAAGAGVATPPHSPTADDTQATLEEYKIGLLLVREVEPPFPHSFDELWREFEQALIDAEGECFKRGYGKAFAMASGNCMFCHHDDGWRPCRAAGKRRPTMEAVGINLHDTLGLLALEHLLVRDAEDAFHMFGLLMLE